MEGLNFGPAARVYIGGKECIKQSFAYGEDPANARIEKIVCRLPEGSPGGALVREYVDYVDFVDNVDCVDYVD